MHFLTFCSVEDLGAGHLIAFGHLLLLRLYLETASNSLITFHDAGGSLHQLHEQSIAVASASI